MFLLPVDSNSLRLKKKKTNWFVNLFSPYWHCIIIWLGFFLDSKENPQASILTLKKNILTDLLASRAVQE